MDGVSAALFVYDATNQKSFEAVKKLCEEIQEYFPGGKLQGNFSPHLYLQVSSLPTKWIWKTEL
jgi:isocitrate lyase